MKVTKEMMVWMGKFGKKYTDRNALSMEEIDRICKEDCGITRTALNSEFLSSIDRSARILEVVSNVGDQLLFLQKGGFKNLYGIEINSYAIELSKSRTRNINIIQGSALDIPFKDNYFDLVFTSGVLIHINPRDIKRALGEIHRCAGNYIWGLEYFSKKYENVIYRGNKKLLWKADFPNIYTGLFPDLKIEKVKYIRYLRNNNVDVMFLLKKNRKRRLRSA